jgi:hypothetical protein
VCGGSCLLVVVVGEKVDVPDRGHGYGDGIIGGARVATARGLGAARAVDIVVQCEDIAGHGWFHGDDDACN